MAQRLIIVEDDLMFGQRARAAARRLGVSPTVIDHDDAGGMGFDAGDVVLVQATLRPERQQALIERLTASTPAPVVIAVTGHLETELRRRLHATGARLATHSAMDAALARALGISWPLPAPR